MVMGLILMCLQGVGETRPAAALPSEDLENAMGASDRELLDRSTLHLLVGVKPGPDEEFQEPVVTVENDPPGNEFPEIREELDGMNLETFDESLSLTDFEAQEETGPVPPEAAADNEFVDDEQENSDVELEP
jgi:hypothetical protein